MFRIFLSIIFFSFFSFFVYNVFFADGSVKKKEVQVLGQETNRLDGKIFSQEENNQNFKPYNFFPLKEEATDELIPFKKNDYKDIYVWSGSSVVIDSKTGTILEYKNGRKRVQVASLSKIMTAVLALEKINNLEEDVIITREALNVYGTVVGCPTSTFCNSNRLFVGEKISAKNLMKAMLLNSANDAATALAIHISGSIEDFAKIMNEKAESLGLKDTSFCTPSGLEISGREHECYSSAYDMARITSYSLKYDLIWDIMKISEEGVYSSDGKYMHQLKNTVKLLDEMPNFFGGKTGFTPLAGKCLIVVANDPTEKHKVVAVSLNDEDRWQNMQKLVDWTFQNYEWR